MVCSSKLAERPLKRPLTPAQKEQRVRLLGLLVELDFGKMDLSRCADVLGLKRFVAEWDVRGAHAAPLFVIAHELWQPRHMALLSSYMKAIPHKIRSRRMVGWVLRRMYAAEVALGRRLHTNGLQSGFIHRVHGIVPYHQKYNWAGDAAQWRAVLKVGRILVTLPGLGAAEFTSAVRDVRRTGLRGIGSGYGAGHLCRSYMEAIGEPLPGGLTLEGMQTLRSCQVDGLIKAAARGSVSVARLIEQLEAIQTEDMEAAIEARYARTPAEIAARTRYMCAKDVYFAMRAKGFFKK
jgi:hypothetical protein